MAYAFSIPSTSGILPSASGFSSHFIPKITQKHNSWARLRLIRVRCEFRVTQMPPIAKEEFYAASVVGIEEVARGIRCVAVEAQISRELVHREDAYTRPGQLATVRLEGEEALIKVPVSSPPFSKDTNWSVLYKMRGDMPSGAIKLPNSTLSVKAPLHLHVCEQYLPRLYRLQEGDELQLGPFEGATGLDLRPVLFISGFPTLIMFASGRGIAVARAIIEANEGDVGSVSLGFRQDVRLYYSAPDPTLIAYKKMFSSDDESWNMIQTIDQKIIHSFYSKAGIVPSTNLTEWIFKSKKYCGKFGEWEKRKVKTRTTVWSTGGKPWDGFVGSFAHMWDEDDIEYDPRTTAAIVCVEENESAEIKELLSSAQIPDNQVIYWNAAAL